ncbi:MAG: PEP/pyruvate-binding domain-containing protein, partial [Synechococcaceae cyanobacterium]|nr:PEP/pyruvate-binding domain-containing protein [Synechococcaceae cyanobacterium]
WAYLQASFAAYDAAVTGGATRIEAEPALFERLATLRAAIERIPLLPDFRERLRTAFATVFGSGIGLTPTFIRSDTNMEDLADFSGAGLNLTVPNVVGEEAFLQAIRRVWASPYRERGYQWRQRYLLNPEDVYPSILVLRSVDVTASGVMITTGISSGNREDVTVAFNRGVGGAVDGQAAETWLLEANGSDRLLAPAREPTYRNLPTTGGVRTDFTSFEQPILSGNDRAALRAMAAGVSARLPTMPGVDTDGPFDVELGFLEGDIVLFQVRPFVENRSAASTAYLQQLDGPVRRRRPNSR